MGERTGRPFYFYLNGPKPQPMAQIKLRLVCTGINEINSPAYASFSKGKEDYNYFSLQIDEETKDFLKVGGEYTFSIEEAAEVPPLVLGTLPQYRNK